MTKGQWLVIDITKAPYSPPIEPNLVTVVSVPIDGLSVNEDAGDRKVNGAEPYMIISVYRNSTEPPLTGDHLTRMVMPLTDSLEGTVPGATWSYLDMGSDGVLDELPDDFTLDGPLDLRPPWSDDELSDAKVDFDDLTVQEDEKGWNHQPFAFYGKGERQIYMWLDGIWVPTKGPRWWRSLVWRYRKWQHNRIR